MVKAKFASGKQYELYLKGLHRNSLSVFSIVHRQRRLSGRRSHSPSTVMEQVWCMSALSWNHPADVMGSKALSMTQSFIQKSW